YRRAVIPAALLLDLVRGLTASTPPPRGLPYLGLEPASGTGFHLLDALSARGIFRKYELVLEVGAGLGGRARWLAARSGCAVEVGSWRCARPGLYRGAGAAAGFVEIEVRDRTAGAPGRAPRVVAARSVLQAKLRSDPRLTTLAVERDALAAALAGGQLAVVQLVARRPA